MNRNNRFLAVATLCFFGLGCGEKTSGETGSERVSPQTEASSALQQVSSESPPLTLDNGIEQTSLSKSADNPSLEPLSEPSPLHYEEGVHYEKLPQQVLTADKSKIEVAEVFWYGCSHCFHFEPVLSAWANGLGEDALLVKTPAMWDQQGVMALHARIYYTAKALGVLDKIHLAAFRALNVEHRQLLDEEEIAQLFLENGVSNEKFTNAFRSFGVTSAVKQADARQRSYRIQGTPEIIVDGTYRVSGRMAGSQEGMLKIADYLMAKIRQQSASP